MDFKITHDLPPYLTSYDLLKTFAVITMVIDHVGVYLFPEQNEWRMIGRMSMPVWMFLIGYANSRDLSKFIWIGALVLVISSFAVGEKIFNVNILFTILITRMTLDYIMAGFLKGSVIRIIYIIGLSLMIIPTVIFFDYGTMAVLFAMVGYLVRHKEKLKLKNSLIYPFTFIVVGLYALYIKYSFRFEDVEIGTAIFGVLVISLLLTQFRAETYPDLSQKIPAPILAPLKFMGRHSLGIYVVHLIALKIVAFAVFPEHFQLFNLRLF